MSHPFSLDSDPTAELTSCPIEAQAEGRDLHQDGKSVSVRYQIIGRAVVSREASPDQHALKLLYRGDGTPWWTCSAGLELVVPASFNAKLGSYVTLTLRLA